MSNSQAINVKIDKEEECKKKVRDLLGREEKRYEASFLFSYKRKTLNQFLKEKKITIQISMKTCKVKTLQKSFQISRLPR